MILLSSSPLTELTREAKMHCEPRKTLRFPRREKKGHIFLILILSFHAAKSRPTPREVHTRAN